jgi:predicted metal-dependent hydrolase
MGVTPASVKITNAMTKLGSCSETGKLIFSWRLMLCSDVEIDYVVVHEPAHLKEFNHGKRFWVIVKSVLPDYKTIHEKLKF